MKFIAIIALAIVTEGIMEYIKMMIPKISEKTWLILLITCAIGVLGAFAFDADIFAILEVEEKIHPVGVVFTGILCGRGANYIYDIIGKFTDGAKK